MGKPEYIENKINLYLTSKKEYKTLLNAISSKKYTPRIEIFNKMINWQCKKGHQWSEILDRKKYYQIQCPRCNNL